MTQCKFEESWRGRCKNESVEGEDYCAEHLKLKCCVCGKQATHDCEETMGGFVCGAPLCDDCEHETQEDGINGNGSYHCKKTEQKYTHWFNRKECPHCGNTGKDAPLKHKWIFNRDDKGYITGHAVICGNCGKLIEEVTIKV